MNVEHDQRRRSRRMLLLLTGCFLLPLVAAFWLYYGSGWRPAGRAQHGELVSPAVPLPAVELSLAGGGTTGANFLRDKWTVLYVGEGSCDARCQRALVDSRQVRLALDKDMTRVRRVFLYRGQCCDAGWLAREQADLIAASLDTPAAATLLGPLSAVAGTPAVAAGRLYVVDPLGNLMMSYAPDARPRDLLEDLERLLKLSHVG